MSKKTSPDIEKQVIDLYLKEKLTTIKITKLLKIGRTTIQDIFKKNNIKARTQFDYSILEGFKNNIDPKIIGDISNLEMIPAIDNLKKQSRCSITLRELINNKSINE